MKIIFRILGSLLFFSISQLACAQQNIQFSNDGFAAALQRSKAENKPVFFMCYASWCPHCKHMKEEICTDSAVALFYNQHFICTSQDMQKGEGIKLHGDFKIKSYPTFIFFDGNGKVIYRAAGEFKAQDFISEGRNALTTEKQLPYLKQQFESDTGNADKCLDYLRALKKGDIDYDDIVKQYFSTQSEKAFLSEANWKIIANGVTDINSREFQFLLGHQKEFSVIASPERVERKIVFLVKELLSPLVLEKDSFNYFIYRKPVAAIHLRKTDSLLFYYDIKLYETTGNWDAYKKETLQSTEQYAWDDYNQLKEVAKIYLEHIPDNAALMQAIKWTKRASTLNEEYSTYLLIAKLLQKINDIPGAIQMVKRGQEMALKYEWDHSEADKLLKALE